MAVEPFDDLRAADRPIRLREVECPLEGSRLGKDTVAAVAAKATDEVGDRLWDDDQALYGGHLLEVDTGRAPAAAAERAGATTSQ